jgi:phosphoglycolate phosphatase-like HAD superfamily hydrolase
MTKAIVFDFDGVLHDTFDIGFKTNQAINPSVTIDNYKDSFNGNLYELKKELTLEDIKTFFAIQAREFDNLVMDEETKKELLKLKENHKLFIVSSNSEISLKKYLERSNLPNECIFVTDTLGDLLEAQKVAVKAVAVNYGFHEAERLKKGNPIAIISNLRELESFL